ncbi:MAG: hypothetical protein AB1757_21360 [Acidobacteriota bacterium]
MRREPLKRNEHSQMYGMSLPQGKTCKDCVHFKKCNAMFGHIEEDETCDWSPSKFQEKRTA